MEVAVLEITVFKKEYIEDAMSLAQSNYEAERRFSPALPESVASPSLSPFAENGLGTAAFEKGKLVGFLCAVPPFPNCFGSTDATGIFSPLGANGAIEENHAEIYARMIEKAAQAWKEAGASNHAICFYAHDTEAQKQSFLYGYGLRCMDAIQILEKKAEPTIPGYKFRELTFAEFATILPLEHMLDKHMAASPTFILRPSATEKELLQKAREQGARYFLAETETGAPAAYMRAAEQDGETFLCYQPGYIHINGAFCLPAHRGSGAASGLLRFVTNRFYREGFSRLGVDFESINPTGHRFWRKYFQIYTHSVARRIDEHVFL